jgi:hypothetical protein
MISNASPKFTDLGGQLMKKVILALMGVALCGSVALADVPNPSFCSVSPGDALNGAYLVPQSGAFVSLSENLVFVANSAGDPIAGSTVVFEFTALNNLCPSGVFTGVTDVNGEVTITLSGGGCAHMVVNGAVVKASGVTIRDYQFAKSSDYDGASGNGTVELPDLIKFSNEFLGVDANECHDYTNDGNTGIEDLIPFSTAFLGGNTCP